MTIRADLHQEPSLEARREYLYLRVSSWNTHNSKKFSTRVGHAFLNARYYDSQRGQFLSEDPVFWEVGQTQDGKAALSNPQAQNSYAYANGNPITNKDPNGRIGAAAAALPFIYVTGDVGLAATAGIWGPPLLIGAGVAAVALGGIAFTSQYIRVLAWTIKQLNWLLRMLIKPILLLMAIGRGLQVQL